MWFDAAARPGGDATRSVTRCSSATGSSGVGGDPAMARKRFEATVRVPARQEPLFASMNIRDVSSDRRFPRSVAAGLAAVDVDHSRDPDAWRKTHAT